jgi:phospholipid/cholesterol/gamma-HCH transport system ATP-binding protein
LSIASESGAGPSREGEATTSKAEGEAGLVELEGLNLAFGKRYVFRDLSLRFPPGRLSVVMGGSGSGKSTLLRIIGGLQRPTRGRVVVDGQDVLALDRRELRQMRRRLGMLFQNGALLDSMPVFDNVALPLREHTKMSEEEIAREVHAHLRAVGLEEVDELLPAQLSGGMLRRVALARSIIMDPEILLCDEPFSGLDPPNVRRIEALLTDLNRKLGLTMIVTSHHVPSARRMAHQLVLLFDGSAVCGTPVELTVSRDPRVVEFLQVDAHVPPGRGGAVSLA